MAFSLMNGQADKRTCRGDENKFRLWG